MHYKTFQSLNKRFFLTSVQVTSDKISFVVKYLKTKMDTSEVEVRYMKGQPIYNLIGEDNEFLELNEEP